MTSLRRLLHHTILLAAMLPGLVGGCGRPAAVVQPAVEPVPVQGPASQARQAVNYRLVEKAEPRPLRIHHLKVDLANPDIELAAALADDPDNQGPATAELTLPLDLARRAGAMAMVNANRWQGLLDAAGRRSTDWREGLGVEILGLAASGGVVRCRPLAEYGSFWVDAAGAAHIGRPRDLSDVRDGVAGFAQLVRAGKIAVPRDAVIQPRTAAGLDATGRWLHLVVVDGRQPGYSEGMANHELAEYMIELGCHDALNLDGGGSSIMLNADEQGELRVVNDPSTKQGGVSVARPIPVGLVVRQR